MIKREELIDKSQSEIQALLEADVNKFVVEVKEIAEESEVIAKEEEIMVLMNENDAHLKSVAYPVADQGEYDGQVYNKETMCRTIADFISTQEVEWSYTLGLYELYKIWKNVPKTIQYHAYDSTLRILGGQKFKGIESWRKILAVNEFLSSSHNDYVRDTAYMIYLSNLHNVVIDALKKFNPEIQEESTARSTGEWEVEGESTTRSTGEQEVEGA